MIITLEERNCDGCGRTFKVSTSSEQRFHSVQCELSGKTWDNPSKKKEPKRESVTVNDTPPTKPLDKKSHYGAHLGVWSTTKELKREPKKITTVSETPKENESTSKNVETPLTPIEESIMPKTEITSEKSSIPVARIATPRTDLTQPYTDLSGEIFRSVNLLSSTETRLHELMHSLTPKKEEPENEYRLIDPDRVKVAAECGKQIVSSIRMKLDLLKFCKEIKDSQGN
jgi:hypothetical protein